LHYFSTHRGEVVTRDQLLDAVWGYDAIPFTRTVDTHVAKLRKKIEDDPARPRHLVTVHRLGYKFTG
jgi:DNA-binding response OmpR family regulator